MKVRIKFDADLVIEADTLADAKDKWVNLPIFTKEAMDCSVEFGEIILVEDAETYDDIENEWNRANHYYP